ncbi:hypothetical protein ACFVIY_41995 [Streptomyces sp. NPDC127166]|uniref:hypothetical protein n=1 Tax=Streptomyces sp. NPDC127166 TaxID=3345380 RepID=UPI003626EF4F
MGEDHHAGPFTRRAFRHPLATHSALDVLGYRCNGSPIYAIAGGSGEGEGGSDGGQSGSSTGGGTDWEAKYREAVSHSRDWEKHAKENKNAATELEPLKAAAMTEQEKALAEAEKAGRMAAEEAAQAKIAKRDAQLRDLTVRDAIRDRAEQHGAKAAALLGSVSFRKKIADLEPADKTFGANLNEAIKWSPCERGVLRCATPWSAC